MQQSNSYIFKYIIALTLGCAIVLSLAFEALKDKQAANVALEKRGFILATFMGNEALSNFKPEDINATFEKRVKGVAVNFKGETVELNAEQLDVAKEYKKLPEERVYPIYLIKDEKGDAIVNYVLPVYGFGLWDNIWGYVALKGDLNTIQGIVFDHKAETPGLGARITTPEIQSRYQGKTIADENGNIVAVVMKKGENGGGDKSIEAFKNNPHEVDGMSGATLTGNGINNMLSDYLKSYANYFQKLKKSQTAQLN